MNHKNTVPQEVKDIAGLIGAFYLKKNGGDYVATAKEITDLQISDVKVGLTIGSKGFEERTVTIVTARPGLLIGKRGTNIDDLTEFFRNPAHRDRGYVTIKIVEEMDPLVRYLIPENPAEFDDFDFMNNLEQDENLDDN